MQKSFSIPDWVKSANVYEVNVRQYTTEGTFAAFEKHLPRLKKMGVNILWFMPITPISLKERLGSLGSYYAAADYKKINPEFGTMKDFTSLVKKAHDMGLKVIIDWVANHTGHDHVWVKEHPEYYKKDSHGKFFDSHGWNDVIDLDYSKESLRKAMTTAMKFWVEKCDIDGFRCDMAHLVPLDYWKTARTELSKLKKNLFWLAETEEVLYHLAFDAMYAWELLHTIENIWQGKASIQTLDGVLKKYDSDFSENFIHLAFTSNHDENSHSGTEFERMGDAAAAFAVLTATWQNFMPLVYSGQELPNKKRLLFFDKDQIEWGKDFWRTDFYSSLLHLHQKNAALHTAKPENLAIRLKTSADNAVFAFARQNKNDQVIVLLNLSSTSQLSCKVHYEHLKGRYKSAFSGLEFQLTEEDSFELKPWDYLVFERISE